MCRKRGRVQLTGSSLLAQLPPAARTEEEEKVSLCRSVAAEQPAQPRPCSGARSCTRPPCTTPCGVSAPAGTVQCSTAPQYSTVQYSTVRTNRFTLIHNLNYWAPFPIDQDGFLSPTFQVPPPSRPNIFL